MLLLNFVEYSHAKMKKTIPNLNVLFSVYNTITNYVVIVKLYLLQGIKKHNSQIVMTIQVE